MYNSADGEETEMKIQQLTPATQKTVRALAKSKGMTVEEVLKYFQNIFFRRKVFRHSRVFS